MSPEGYYRRGRRRGPVGPVRSSAAPVTSPHASRHDRDHLAGHFELALGVRAGKRVSERTARQGVRAASGSPPGREALRAPYGQVRRWTWMLPPPSVSPAAYGGAVPLTWIEKVSLVPGSPPSLTVTTKCTGLP